MDINNLKSIVREKRFGPLKDVFLTSLDVHLDHHNRQCCIVDEHIQSLLVDDANTCLPKICTLIFSNSPGG